MQYMSLDVPSYDRPTWRYRWTRSQLNFLGYVDDREFIHLHTGGRLAIWGEKRTGETPRQGHGGIMLEWAADGFVDAGRVAGRRGVVYTIQTSLLREASPSREWLCSRRRHPGTFVCRAVTRWQGCAAMPNIGNIRRSAFLCVRDRK